MVQCANDCPSTSGGMGLSECTDPKGVFQGQLDDSAGLPIEAAKLQPLGLLPVHPREANTQLSHS